MGAILTVAFLFLLICGFSATVDVSVFKKRLESKCGLIVGMVCQFLVLPFFGFCSARLFRLDPVFGVTLLFTTCSPGGAFSNWWCSLFNADLALSIAMTSCSTVASVIFMPLNLLLYVQFSYGESVALDWWALIGSLIVALAAVFCGLTLSGYFPHRRDQFNTLGNIAGVGLLATGAFTSSRDDPIWDKDLVFYIAVALPCVAGLAFSFLLASLTGLDGPQRVAVSVESCYQNTGIATTLALATFDEDVASAAVGVPLYYGLVEIVLLPLFLLCAWKAGLTHAPAGLKLCTVLLESFQPYQVTDITPVDLGRPDPAPHTDAEAQGATDEARPPQPPPVQHPRDMVPDFMDVVPKPSMAEDAAAQQCTHGPGQDSEAGA